MKRFNTRAFVVLIIALAMLAIINSLPGTYGDDLGPEPTASVVMEVIRIGVYCNHFETIAGERVLLIYRCEP